MTKPLSTLLLTACLLIVASCARPLARKTLKKGNDQIAYWTAEGGVVIKRGDSICVAPPAQAARNIDTRGKAGASASQLQAALDVEVEVDHESERLFEQTNSILFFRFAMYRLCEMHANGAIGKEQYVALYQDVVQLGRQLVEAEIAFRKAEEKKAEKEAKFFGRFFEGDGDTPAPPK